jgi:hypothetical protein
VKLNRLQRKQQNYGIPTLPWASAVKLGFPSLVMVDSTRYLFADMRMRHWQWSIFRYVRHRTNSRCKVQSAHVVHFFRDIAQPGCNRLLAVLLHFKREEILQSEAREKDLDQHTFLRSSRDHKSGRRIWLFASNLRGIMKWGSSRN